MFSLYGNHKWLHLLDAITTQYNNSKHSTTKMKPSQINSKSVENKLLNTVYNHIKIAEDINGQTIKGAFYEFELQRSKQPDVYLVEKVLKRRKSQVFVKWLGFDSSHNSWIPKDNIV
nr:uncharacterized protein LOC111415556 [Onthophagus taurus]